MMAATNRPQSTARRENSWKPAGFRAGMPPPASRETASSELEAIAAGCYSASAELSNKPWLCTGQLADVDSGTTDPRTRLVKFSAGGGFRRFLCWLFGGRLGSFGLNFESIFIHVESLFTVQAFDELAR